MIKINFKRLISLLLFPGQPPYKHFHPFARAKCEPKNEKPYLKFKMLGTKNNNNNILTARHSALDPGILYRGRLLLLLRLRSFAVRRFRRHARRSGCLVISRRRLLQRRAEIRRMIRHRLLADGRRGHRVEHGLQPLLIVDDLSVMVTAVHCRRHVMIVNHGCRRAAAKVLKRTDHRFLHTAV